MGIEVARFVGEFFDSFLCPICLDVVEDPIMMSTCEHLFCKVCFDTMVKSSIALCPTCREAANKNGSKPLNHVLKSIYGSLKMQCMDPSCEEKLTISNYKHHDETCPKINFNCPDCGFNVKKLIGEEKIDHNCIQFLKGKIKQLELELVNNQKVKEPKRGN